MEVKSPNYVKAKGYLEGTDNFDAPFFDYTPQDASLMDPQLRVFHECAWSALEHAGYNIETYPGLIGVYSGASLTYIGKCYLLFQRQMNQLGNF